MKSLKIHKIKDGEIFVFISRNNISSNFNNYIPAIHEYKIFKIKDNLYLYKDIFHLIGKKHSGLIEVESLSTIISNPGETTVKIENTISLFHPLIGVSSSGLDIKIDQVIAIFEGDKSFLEDFNKNSEQLLYI